MRRARAAVHNKYMVRWNTGVVKARLAAFAVQTVGGGVDVSGGRVEAWVEASDHHPVRIKKLMDDGRVEPFCIPEPEGLRRQD